MIWGKTAEIVLPEWEIQRVFIIVTNVVRQGSYVLCRDRTPATVERAGFTSGADLELGQWKYVVLALLGGNVLDELGYDPVSD